jgi:fumarylacetoacetase
MTSVFSLDETHDPARQSWVSDANSHPDFPLQNLPFGMFRPQAHGQPLRVGTAIGSMILDLDALARSSLLSGEAETAADALIGASSLNALLALDARHRRLLRQRLFNLLSRDAAPSPAMQAMLYPADECVMGLPVAIGDYTDFYAGIHHATHVGRLFRPDQPLMPNYKHVPIGYHGRASSVRVSGEPVRRPWGQLMPPQASTPLHAPSKRLDYELELAIWLGGAANPLGEPVPIARAHERIAGFGLLNDWSARDVQAWEYQPLGPFLAKSFHTSVSPWIITAEAMAPFRQAQAPRPEGDPAPLAYLHDAHDQAHGALRLELQVWLSTTAMREADLPPFQLSQAEAAHLYWTPAQLVAHHASGGCDLRPGDLLGSGTISGPERSGYGSLLEITEGGKQPVTLPHGESRAFLHDGDAIILRARASRPGFISIGFGACAGRIAPAWDQT